MSEWKEVNSSDYCYKITDGTHDSPKRCSDGRFLITSKHIKGTNIDFDNAYFISEEDYQKIIKRSKVDQWDVLISMIGEYCGFCHLEDSNNTEYAVKNVGIMKIGDEYKAKWLYYYLNSPKGKAQLFQSRAGSSQPYIALSALRNLTIPVPNDLALSKIVEILSRYDSLIENYQKQIKLLEEAAQRLYKEWFIDLRFPGHENTKIVDGVPEGWEEKSIMEVFDFKYGKILPTKYFVEDGPIPVYGASKQIGRYTKANCFEPKVLIGSRGNAGFVHRTIEDETYVTNNSFIVEPTKEYTFLRLPYIYESFKAMDFVAICTGAAQPQLTLNSIASLKYIVPTKKLITIYCDVSISFFTKIAMSYKQIRLLIEARDRLLPKLMSGEINVES